MASGTESLDSAAGLSTSHADVFRRLLGDSFDSLPPAVQAVHRPYPLVRLKGEGSVARGNHLACKILAFFAQLPPAADNIQVHIEIKADSTKETWARRFGKHPMKSTLKAKNSLLVEKLGPASLAFRLQAFEHGIRWLPEKVWLLGIPLPLAWFTLTATEELIDQRYTFDVRAEVIGCGLLVHYKGWLEADT